VEKSSQDKLVSDAEKMRCMFNQKWIQLILLILAILVSWCLQQDYVDIGSERGVTSWAIHDKAGIVEMTMAGLWFMFISSPLFSFLVYRWVWRFIIWSLFLFHVSRLKLRLFASHTDLAAGLGLIGRGQILFGIISVVLACIISANLADDMFMKANCWLA
jgi:hypothetical protein